MPTNSMFLAAVWRILIQISANRRKPLRCLSLTLAIYHPFLHYRRSSGMKISNQLFDTKSTCPFMKNRKKRFPPLYFSLALFSTSVSRLHPLNWECAPPTAHLFAHFSDCWHTLVSVSVLRSEKKSSSTLFLKADVDWQTWSRNWSRGHWTSVVNR